MRSKLVLLIAFALLHGCGDPSGEIPGACKPQSITDCLMLKKGNELVHGIRVCNENGTGYGTCQPCTVTDDCATLQCYNPNGGFGGSIWCFDNCGQPTRLETTCSERQGCDNQSDPPRCYSCGQTNTTEAAFYTQTGSVQCCDMTQTKTACDPVEGVRENASCWPEEINCDTITDCEGIKACPAGHQISSCVGQVLNCIPIDAGLDEDAGFDPEDAGVDEDAGGSAGTGGAGGSAGTGGTGGEGGGAGGSAGTGGAGGAGGAGGTGGEAGTGGTGGEGGGAGGSAGTGGEAGTGGGAGGAGGAGGTGGEAGTGGSAGTGGTGGAGGAGGTGGAGGSAGTGGEAGTGGGAGGTGGAAGTGGTGGTGGAAGTGGAGGGTTNAMCDPSSPEQFIGGGSLSGSRTSGVDLVLTSFKQTDSTYQEYLSHTEMYALMEQQQTGWKPSFEIWVGNNGDTQLAANSKINVRIFAAPIDDIHCSTTCLQDVIDDTSEFNSVAVHSASNSQGLRSGDHRQLTVMGKPLSFDFCTAYVDRRNGVDMCLAMPFEIGKTYRWFAFVSPEDSSIIDPAPCNNLISDPRPFTLVP